MEMQSWGARALAYVRAHKAQVAAVAVAAAALITRFVPAFPGDDVVHIAGALLNLV